jgi:hypothetical protein
MATLSFLVKQRVWPFLCHSEGVSVSRKVTVQIFRQEFSLPRGDKYWATELRLRDESGNEMTLPVLLHNFEEAARLLTREAGTTYEELQKAMRIYDTGNPASVKLNLTDEQMSNIGFRFPERNGTAVR